ncbi:MAG: energy-coupling factor ABC transporter permease [Bifidobacteriaceae bacterium]|jgi:cobalt/nickel transport system permease protein|nr:energy-coupling factor ABC transporter permease [Bifidobacteriaceae bacterium]
MHVPDHFLNDPTSVATGVLAAGALVAATLQARRPTWAWADPSPTRGDGGGDAPKLMSLTDRAGAPAFAATTALVFGLQMLNYPVSQGTSGHLLGGALAAALLGPARGILSVSAVLAVQCLAFADGGLTALGTNILLMAVVATLTGWAVERARPRGAVGIAAVAALGGAVSVPVTAAAFTALYAIGGTEAVNFGELAGSMLGLHLLIGLGEGLITGLVVAAVAFWAPGFAAIDQRQPEGRPAAFALGGLAVVAAAALSPLASGWPDGLESAAEAVGFADAARSHVFEAGALADYGSSTGLSVGLVGLIGLALCVAVGLAAAPLLRVRRLATA